MLNFTFCNPTKIVFGEGEIKQLNKLLPDNSKILIVYDKIVKKLGILDKAMIEINKGNREVFEFDKIEPNPKLPTLMEAINLVRKEKIDFLLAIGGGSTIDGTKFIGIASANDQFIGRESEILELSPNIIDEVLTGSVPFGTIVTLPATSSEMNPHAVVTNGEDKLGITTKYNYPQFSIVDPTYTYTLPKIQVTNGLADSMIHVLEQYITYPVGARFQDRFAEGLISSIIEVAEENLNNPSYSARANFVWCATLAHNGLAGSGVPVDFATHMIGHEVTALFGIAHAPSLTLIMPALWKVKKEDKKEKLAQYAERVWGVTDGDLNFKADQAIEKTENFFKSLGLKTRFSEYGLTMTDLEPILELLEKHGMTALTERGDVNLDISRKILEAAL